MEEESESMLLRGCPDERTQEEEAEKIYRALFGVSVPPLVKARFLTASTCLNEKLVRARGAADAGGGPTTGAGRPEDLQTYYRALGSIRDLGAFELACRYRRRLPIVSLKFHLMVYMAETIPENQKLFVKERDGVSAALWALVGGALRTAFKLAKGLYLLRKAEHA